MVTACCSTEQSLTEVLALQVCSCQVGRCCDGAVFTDKRFTLVSVCPSRKLSAFTDVRTAVGGDRVKAEWTLSQLPSCYLVFLAELLVSDVGGDVGEQR